jgi:rSAM/selenodomain-associated transferase 1
MLFPQSRLMVFCKAPELGKVKTRISKPLDERGLEGKQIAVETHEYLALHTLRNITESNSAPVQLWCSPDKSHPFFQQCENEFGVELKNQGQGDLGERMSRAFDDVLSKYDSAVVIGTDCPMLNSTIVEEAFTLLQESECSVIGPAEDGGYVLLGLSENQPDIFQDIAWGSTVVLEETIKKMNGPVSRLPKMWDVDRPEDLQRLQKEAAELGLSDVFARFLNGIA